MEHKEIDIDVAAVTKQALQDRQAGEDFDEALLRVCKHWYGGSGFAAFETIRNALGALAEQSKIDVETALRQIAEGKTSLRVVTVIQQTTRTQKIPMRALDDLPPEVRAEVEKALASGKSGEVVITRKVVGGKESVSPPLGVKKPMSLDHCRHCGYEFRSDWASCPQCGKARKRSFWSRLFGG